MRSISIGTRRLLTRCFTLALTIAVAGCGQPLATTPSAWRPTAAASAAPTPTARPSAPPSATMSPTPAPPATATPDPANDPVFVGAGDIAACGSGGAEMTAQLL